MRITRNEIQLAVTLVEPRLRDMPNTFDVIRRYVAEREGERGREAACCIACGRELSGRCHRCATDRASGDRLGDGSRVPMPGDDDGWGDE